MNIGEESEPVELPIPVHPDEIPVETPGVPDEAPARERISA